MDVPQWAELMLPIQEVHDSNPVHGKFYTKHRNEIFWVTKHLL